MDICFNAIGLIGVLMILAAYFLLQVGKVTAYALRYLLLNLIGATAVLFSLLRFWNLPSFVIESAWVAVSVYGLVTRGQKKGA